MGSKFTSSRVSESNLGQLGASRDGYLGAIPYPEIRILAGLLFAQELIQNKTRRGNRSHLKIFND